jgi:hypothetical protein
MLHQPRSQEETPCTRTQEVPDGKPFSTREENPAKSFAIFFKINTFTTKKYLAHKRVLKP